MVLRMIDARRAGVENETRTLCVVEVEVRRVELGTSRISTAPTGWNVEQHSREG